MIQGRWWYFGGKYRQGFRGLVSGVVVIVEQLPIGINRRLKAKRSR